MYAYEYVHVCMHMSVHMHARIDDLAISVAVALPVGETFAAAAGRFMQDVPGRRPAHRGTY